MEGVLNDEEDDMLSFCSEETGEAKSVIFRKALKSYYENAKFFKNVLKSKEENPESKTESEKYDEYEDYLEDEYEDYGMEGISLKRAMECPYCGSENNMDFADDCETSSE